MIDAEKLPSAIYALHGIILKARIMAYEGASNARLAGLLDAAEMLPRLIANKSDETLRFRQYVDEISSEYDCKFVLQRFDNPVPVEW